MLLNSLGAHLTTGYHTQPRECVSCVFVLCAHVCVLACSCTRGGLWLTLGCLSKALLHFVYLSGQSLTEPEVCGANWTGWAVFLYFPSLGLEMSAATPSLFTRMPGIQSLVLAYFRKYFNH